jgi:hypothetical protein
VNLDRAIPVMAVRGMKCTHIDRRRSVRWFRWLLPYDRHNQIYNTEIKVKEKKLRSRLKRLNFIMTMWPLDYAQCICDASSIIKNYFIHFFLLHPTNAHTSQNKLCEQWEKNPTTTKIIISQKFFRREGWWLKKKNYKIYKWTETKLKLNTHFVMFQSK